MKVATWNLQGRNAGRGRSLVSTFAMAKSIMKNNDIDVFCLQEVGNLDLILGTDYCEVVGRLKIGIDNYVEYIYVPYGINRRCSMLTLMKVGHRDRRYKPRIYTEIGRRCAFGVLFDGVWVYNVHAPASRGARQYDCSLVHRIKRWHGSFIVAGDFNMDASLMKDELHGIEVYCVQGRTQQRGNTLDYFISRKKCLGIKYASFHTRFDYLLETFALSDHRPVCAEFL